MKIFLSIVCVSLVTTLFVTGQYTTAVTLSSATGTPLQLLTELVKVHNLNVSFSPADCPSDVVVKITSKNMSINDLLSDICAQSGLKMKKVGNQFVLTKNDGGKNKVPQATQQTALVNSIDTALPMPIGNSHQGLLLTTLEGSYIMCIKSCRPNAQLSYLHATSLQMMQTNENHDVMREKSILKSVLLASAMFVQQAVTGQHSWAISGGINAATPRVINNTYSFFAGLASNSELPFHFNLYAALEFDRRIAGSGDEHFSYTGSNGVNVVTAHETFSVSNKYYGLTMPLVLSRNISLGRFSPSIGAGMYYSYSLWGTSTMHFNDAVNHKSLTAWHAIEWNKPSDSKWVKSEADKMLFQSGQAVLNRSNYGWLLEVGVRYSQLGFSLMYAEGLNSHVNYYSSAITYDIKFALRYYFKSQTIKPSENENVSTVQ